MSSWLFRRFTFSAFLSASTVTAFFLGGCAEKPALVTGGLYTVESGDSSYAVVKILVIEGDLVHVRLFKNKWPTRPDSVDVSTLSLGTIYDKDGMGVGHVPLARKTFLQWKPVFITKQTVSNEELEGYWFWKKDRGGAFGSH